MDHPAGTDIFVDERFVIPPAQLGITTVETPHSIAHAVDDNGQDVTDVVRALDGKYLDTFGRGQYISTIDIANNVKTNFAKCLRIGPSPFTAPCVREARRSCTEPLLKEHVNYALDRQPIQDAFCWISFMLDGFCVG